MRFYFEKRMLILNTVKSAASTQSYRLQFFVEFEVTHFRNKFYLMSSKKYEKRPIIWSHEDGSQKYFIPKSNFEFQVHSYSQTREVWSRFSSLKIYQPWTVGFSVHVYHCFFYHLPASYIELLHIWIPMFNQKSFAILARFCLAHFPCTK